MGTGEWRRWALLVVGTAAGTVVLALLRLPSPALFAGLVAATVLALTGQAPAVVPRHATTLAQAVIGVVIGVLAQPSALTGLAADWLPVLLITIGTLAVSMAAGVLLGLHRGVTPLTGMLALTAGGASGLVAVSRDLGGDDRVVAVVQYLRVGIVTASMPLIAALGYGATAGAGGTCRGRRLGPGLARLPRRLHRGRPGPRDARPGARRRPARADDRRHRALRQRTVAPRRRRKSSWSSPTR